jgi:hypothetical protein
VGREVGEDAHSVRFVGKAAQSDAIRIDLVCLGNDGDAFEDVGLTGLVKGVVAAAEQFNLNGAGQVRAVGSPPREGVDELYFVASDVAAVLNDTATDSFRKNSSGYIRTQRAASAKISTSTKSASLAPAVRREWMSPSS